MEGLAEQLQVLLTSAKLETEEEIKYTRSPVSTTRNFDANNNQPVGC
jgi:hypothetical protein